MFCYPVYWGFQHIHYEQLTSAKIFWGLCLSTSFIQSLFNYSIRISWFIFVKHWACDTKFFLCCIYFSILQPHRCGRLFSKLPYKGIYNKHSLFKRIQFSNPLYVTHDTCQNVHLTFSPLKGNKQYVGRVSEPFGSIAKHLYSNAPCVKLEYFINQKR